MIVKERHKLSVVRARWQVVVDLILDMKNLGHPSFIKLNMEEVKENAAQLPEDGVPPEVIKTVYEELGDKDEPMESKLLPQKAATPCEAPIADPAVAGATFAAQRPRAVVAEGRSHHAAHEAEKCALEDLAAELQTFEVRAGNQLLDMFRPCYWSVAFCFLFKHATAEPDVSNSLNKSDRGEAETSRRRKGNRQAPEVGIWAAAMQRQMASQFRRDWNFSPALWNYLFRTMINLQPNASMYSVPGADGNGHRALTNKEIESGVQEIYKTLQDGTYTDVNGESKAVKGDMSKLRRAPGLSAAARKVLSNVEARTRNVPGTHEVRTTMRQQTHAYRVSYGAALFITFSPSERDSAIMVRMARARQTDPAIAQDEFKAFYGREKPQLDVEFCRLSPERLAEA